MAKKGNAAKATKKRMVPKSYQETESYKALSKSERRMLVHYTKDSNVTDEQLLWQFWEKDIENIPEDEMQRASFPGQIMILFMAMIDVTAINSGEFAAVALATLSLFVVIAIYATGSFNPTLSQQRKLKKQIKQSVGDYTFWKFMEMEKA